MAAPHAPRGPASDVIGVVRRPVADDLRENRRAALFRMLKLLEHHKPRALAHDKAVALLIERDAQPVAVGRVGKRLHIVKARDRDIVDRRFCASGNRQVEIAVFDLPKRLADEWLPVAQAVTTAKLSPLKPIFNRDLSAAILQIIIGIMNTDTRSGPFSRNFLCSASVV